ncbi:hypothetical protein BC829DRAFT_393452 [Chytridium lagenaria]|nr:hypothetical protein BC829DRAFT_393452 [Chytridium lagenaria]
MSTKMSFTPQRPSTTPPPPFTDTEAQPLLIPANVILIPANTTPQPQFPQGTFFIPMTKTKNVVVVGTNFAKTCSLVRHVRWHDEDGHVPRHPRHPHHPSHSLRQPSADNYEYPDTPTLIPTRETERPLHCQPHEAKFPINNLKVQLSGLGVGQIAILPAPVTSLSSKAYTDIHFHLSNPSIPVWVEHEILDGTYLIHVVTPKSFDGIEDDEDEKHHRPCIGAAVTVYVPEGALKGWKKLDIVADIAAVNIHVGVGKFVNVENHVGSVNVSSMAFVEKVVIDGRTGSINVNNVIVQKTISTSTNTGSIKLQTVSGSFTDLTMKAETGSIDTVNVQLPTTATTITAKTSTGSHNVRLVDFYGAFKVQTKSWGSVRVKGTGVDFTRNTRGFAEGERRKEGGVVGVHKLDMTLSLGSADVKFE